jgi:prepilin-type N-terminal cleavage/methylation domain-containing protein/prepilin-type processing-associated H-X9-DG protein
MINKNIAEAVLSFSKRRYLAKDDSARKRLMQKAKAFTLIELLVVIAVIALLISIIIPALTKTKEQARFVLCQTNLKSYGQAGNLYLAEHDDAFPDSYTWLHADGAKSYVDPCAWHDAEYLADGSLWPYLELDDIHMCPIFYMLSQKLGQDHPSHNESIPIDPQYSYSMNGYLGFGFFGEVEKSGQIKKTTSVIFFSEENVWTIPGLSQFALNNNNLVIRDDGTWNNLATYHKIDGTDLNSGVANAVFVDGHVDTAKAEDSFKSVWPL